jgi:hypothetical protein
LTEDLCKFIDLQKKSGGAVGPSASGSGFGGEFLMAAVGELATSVGSRAACRTSFAPRASPYRQMHASICEG